MKKNYENIIPKKYQTASYETDVSDVIKAEVTKQIKNKEGVYASFWAHQAGGFIREN